MAGIPNIETDRSLLRETADHYRQVGVRNSVANKFDNFAVPHLYKNIPIGAPPPLFDGGGGAMVTLAATLSSRRSR